MSQIPILVAGIVILCIIIFFVFSNKEDTPESTNTPQSSGVSPLVTDTSTDYDFDSIIYDGVSSELNINS